VIAWLLLAALGLAGCAPNLADIVTALGKDPASNCIRVTSIYATVLMSRTNLTSGSMACTSDGMSMKSDPQVGAQGVFVPVQVAPQTLAPVKP
jgi:hypothetical protein